jgi:hypothetical protein
MKVDGKARQLRVFYFIRWLVACCIATGPICTFDFHTKNGVKVACATAQLFLPLLCGIPREGDNSFWEYPEKEIK